MAKDIRVSEPSLEMQEKIKRARRAIASQKMRTVKCPYCQHNTIVVFEDTRGHVQAKCKRCGHETVFDVLSMRRLKLGFYQGGYKPRLTNKYFDSCAVEPLIGESS